MCKVSTGKLCAREGRKALDKRRVIYYTDELHDEFSKAKIPPKKIDENYIYGYSSLWKRFTHFFWYRIVAGPLAFIYTKLVFRHKIVGAEVLKPYRSVGYFMYGNHTQDIGDALIPNMIEKRKDKYVIVNPSNLAIPVVGRVVPSLGGIPLPDNLRAHKNFTSIIERRICEGCAVVIYPEAHIWPYYTKIRNFPDTSFHYPIKLGVPTFCFTNTYKKRGKSKRPQIVTYVDGPFFPSESLPQRERRRDLRDRIHERMCERAGLSDMTVIKYIKKEEKND